jgi:hypothetical protein
MPHASGIASLRGVRFANKKNGGGLIDAFQLGLGPA